MLPSLGATIPAHIVCPSGTRVLADSVVVVVGCRIRCHRTSVDVRDTLAGTQVGPRSYAARRDHFLEEGVVATSPRIPACPATVVMVAGAEEIDVHAVRGLGRRIQAPREMVPVKAVPQHLVDDQIGRAQVGIPATTA